MANHPKRGKAKPPAGPSAAEIRDARERAQLTQTQAAELVHAALRTWQQWEADEALADHRRMPLAAWELFRLKLDPELAEYFAGRARRR